MASVVMSKMDPEFFFKGLGTDPLGVLARLREEGTVCAVPDIRPGAGGRFVVTSEPDVASAVLAHGTRRQRGSLHELIGEGLFVVGSGDHWRRRRALVRPAFTTAAVAANQAAVDRTAAEFVRRDLVPRSGQEINLAEAMRRVSIEVLVRAADPTTDEAELAATADALAALSDFFNRLLYAPDSIGPELHAAVRTHRGTVESFVARRAARTDGSGTDHGHLAAIAAALAGSDDAAQVLREEAFSVFTAGVETVGALLTWAFINLTRHPAVLGRALDQVLEPDAGAKAPGRPGGSPDFLGAIVEETLRMNPPNWALIRVLDRSVEAAGVRLDPGDTVMVSIAVMHNDPALWDGPQEFRPDRFLGDARPPARRFLPFGTGPHQCLGRQLAYQEARSVLTAVLRGGLLTVADQGRTEGLRLHVVMAPDPDPVAVFSPHRGSAA